MGLLHHLDDLGQHGILTHLGGLKCKGPRLVDGGSNHLISHVLLHGDGFACDHGFVHRGMTLFDDSIDRDFFSGAHNYQIPDGHLFNGDVHFLTIPHNPGGFRLQPDQFLDGLGSLPFCPCLEKSAQQNEHDNGPGRVKIDLSRQPLGRKESG